MFFLTQLDNRTYCRDQNSQSIRKFCWRLLHRSDQGWWAQWPLSLQPPSQIPYIPPLFHQRENNMKQRVPESVAGTCLTQSIGQQARWSCHCFQWSPVMPCGPWPLPRWCSPHPGEGQRNVNYKVYLMSFPRFKALAGWCRWLIGFITLLYRI